MTDIGFAAKSGDELLKQRMASFSSSFSQDETAYHLTVSYALTGIALYDPTTAADACTRAESCRRLPASELLKMRGWMGSKTVDNSHRTRD